MNTVQYGSQSLITDTYRSICFSLLKESKITTTLTLVIDYITSSEKLQLRI